MRRRWHVSEGFVSALGGIWIIGWIPAFFIIWGFGAPGGLDSKDDYVPGLVFLAVWFGVVVVPAVLVGAVRLVVFLWRERPRRVVVPVSEDLREVSR